MRKESLPIASPCTESWDAMEGDDRRRACQKCSKDVVDLSTMTRGEVTRLLGRERGQDLCVRYSFDDAGNVELRQLPVVPLIPAALLARGRDVMLGASLAAAALAGCNPAGPAGDAVLAREAIKGATEQLAQRGTCSVSMEPLLPMELRLHAAPCVPEKPAPAQPAPAPVQPAEQAPLPPPPSPERAAAASVPDKPADPKPAQKPAKQPCHKKEPKGERYPHKLMGKIMLPRDGSGLD